MDKEDMIALIEAFESIQNLVMAVTDLTGGYTINNPKYNGLFNIYEIIKRNSIYAAEDADTEERYDAIINAMNISVEEKCTLLLGE